MITWRAQVPPMLAWMTRGLAQQAGPRKTVILTAVPTRYGTGPAARA
jgi:hypothetical protein